MPLSVFQFQEHSTMARQMNAAKQVTASGVLRANTGVSMMEAAPNRGGATPR